MKVLKMLQMVYHRPAQYSVMTLVYMAWKSGIKLSNYSHHVSILGKEESKCMSFKNASSDDT